MSEPPALNVLIAFPYVSNPMLDRVAGLGDRARWLLDSGAFSAFKQNRTVALDDYCRYIERLTALRPWRYFVLDVIGDPKATRANYDLMRKRGLNPVPIFTRGCQLEELDAYYETADLVGLGGVAGHDASAYAWVKRVMQHVAGRPVHILGFTDASWLKYLRPYSVDSSTWQQSVRYGLVDVYMGQGAMKQFRRRTIIEAAPPKEVMARIQALGFDPYLLQDNASWTGQRSLIAKLNAASWVAAMIDFGRHCDTKLFLASTTEPVIGNIVEAFERLSPPKKETP